MYMCMCEHIGRCHQYPPAVDFAATAVATLRCSMKGEGVPKVGAKLLRGCEGTLGLYTGLLETLRGKFGGSKGSSKHPWF